LRAGMTGEGMTVEQVSHALAMVSLCCVPTLTHARLQWFVCSY
jgi:hypothetical protein